MSFFKWCNECDAEQRHFTNNGIDYCLGCSLIKASRDNEKLSKKKVD